MFSTKKEPTINDLYDVVFDFRKTKLTKYVIDVRILLVDDLCFKKQIEVLPVVKHGSSFLASRTLPEIKKLLVRDDLIEDSFIIPNTTLSSIDFARVKAQITGELSEHGKLFELNENSYINTSHVKKVDFSLEELPFNGEEHILILKEKKQ